MVKPYADETYYINEYLGTRKPAIRAGFDFYARTASRIIDQHTFDQMKHLATLPEEAMMCCCELAETEYQREKQKNASRGKTSEKVGTYSVSFSGAGEQAAAAGNEQRAIVLKWLADTGLCYRGVG